MDTQQMVHRARIALVSGMLGSLVACGGGGRDGVTGPKVDETNFTATVSGSVSASHAGAAVYLVSPGGAQNGAFGMTFSDPRTAAGFTISRIGGSIPVVGSHPVANIADRPQEAQTMVSIAYSPGGTTNRTFLSTGGTLTITSVGGGHVKGTFNFTARVLCNCSSPETVTVTGSFDAVG